jgi:two-component system, NtrC family, nitrogen regulation response regulator NtrX
LTSSIPLVVVIDDDDSVRATSVALLKAGGYATSAAASVGEALRVLEQRIPAAVLLDLKLPDGTGIDVLRWLQRQSPGTPVVVMSGYGRVSDAVEAMRVGAAEFLEKPVSRADLMRTLARLIQGPRTAAGPEPADGSRYGMVGRSELMARVYQLIEMAAPTRCRVFVWGESGTGKELVARAIHALSPRREQPFVKLNCAAIPAELIESELFGHVRGAFTGAVSDRKGLFESAHGGTLFLDEIGEMSLMTQAKLLRVLQENELTPVGTSAARAVDVRIISATSKNLEREIQRGTFREDLYHRINVLTIALAPLRERRADIPELAEHFLRLACVQNGVPTKKLSAASFELLSQLEWKGNVRQLNNAMERLAVLVAHSVIDRADAAGILQVGVHTAHPGSMTLREAKTRFERDYIVERLTANGGQLLRTARDLGIERTNLYRKMRQLGIGMPKDEHELQ